MELTGFSDHEVEQLKALGLTSEISAFACSCPSTRSADRRSSPRSLIAILSCAARPRQPARPDNPLAIRRMTMLSPASELSRALASNVEAVCRRYLSNGRRHGAYWTAGDVLNTPGRSLYVRLTGPTSGKGAAGHWTDAATGQHGDLLDLIALNCGLSNLRDAMDEARLFLALPFPEPATTRQQKPGPRASPEAARRLFRAGRPIVGTPAEAYLRARRIAGPLNFSALRFHPSVYYREHEDAPRQAFPALLAAVTDLDGTITGVHRTWLDAARRDKARVADPRRSMGSLLGNCVRFGSATDLALAGEGIETVLSLRSVLPNLPMVAGLSANHLAALDLPSTLRRLYIAIDDDPAGRDAAVHLRHRAEAHGIEVVDVAPQRSDFNHDLRRFGPAALLESVIRQLVPDDRIRFAPSTVRSRPQAA
jgi:hypothetical protein